MSPTPVTFNPPNAPSTYSWEATDEEVAARYGIDPSSDRPVRPQHLAHPAGARPAPAGGRPVRGAAVRIPADRLPPPGRGGGGPLRRDRVGDPRRGRRRRDPRHRRQGVHPGRRAGRRPGPDLRHVPGPHRAARRPGRRGPATRRGGGLVARPGSDARRRRWTPRSSGCAARTTRPRWPSRTARSATCSAGSPRTPPRPAGPLRSSSSTRPTPSSSGRRSSGCATTYPQPDRRPHREQGLRAGRAAGRVRRRPARADRHAQPVSSARLGVDGVGHARDRGAARSRDPRRQPRPRRRRSGPACATRSSRRAGRSGRR